MSFRVLTPPKTEEAMAERGQQVIDAAGRLGLELDPKGFLMSWVGGGTRVVIEDEEGEISNLVLVAMGKRWTHKDHTAHVLQYANLTPELIDFLKQISSAAGCNILYIPVEGLTSTLAGRVAEMKTEQVYDDEQSRELMLAALHKFLFPGADLHSVLSFDLEE